MSVNTNLNPAEELTMQVKKYANAGEYEKALQLVQAVVHENVESVAMLHTAFQLTARLNRLDLALNYVDRALAQAPEQPVFLLNKIQTLLRLKRREEVLELTERAGKLLTDNAKYQHAISKIYTQLDMPAKALPVLEELVKNNPDETDYRYDLALCQFFLNDTKAAEKNLDKVIAANPEGAPAAIHVRSALRKQTKKNNHIEFLTERTKSDDIKDVPVWFALAKEYEDLGEFDESFKALEAGNKLKRSKIQYDEKAELSALQSLVDSSKDLKIGAKKAAKKGEPTPVFIVGMPRTGTTLLENLLSSHSKVKSMGELPDFPRFLADAIDADIAAAGGNLPRTVAAQNLDFKALGERYMKSVQELADGHDYVVDKLPFNFLYCGLIQKALPHAKIIHVQRDAMDTCFAIYKTFFNQVYAYSYDQEELARYYGAYQRLMQHWHKLMGKRLIAVRYEDLVKETESSAQTVFEYCGIDWEPEVMEFYSKKTPSSTASAAQVRLPVYTSSVDKWKKFKAHLEPMQAQLQKELAEQSDK
ncbi:Tetratricopeptide repeat-containing protein [Pseudidiomarina planktonica]|uniref:Tetratricopeptide repeat-containing protein n=1 Tax=Pseudidiomarina planktonica TaxID=1323738 RepID=A0A1Y6EHX0_9GAMM|nr:sulfotransferase [Pseudidiomarina planktonica]RUO65896.1 hypothetical protein CWI77_05555 [Pseudidiomarina planktonica]SMQ61969.1 Tetratricopeptide repeat-containing protein [Pseudidiomarina planktonica]